ncbi:SynChlorMet cassette radical SAM/SPASM protein ScmE [Candidatus Fermentibacterales bacterium]|nr:SynChlorMet cassette radical SAM/SPASM protein ScmE [Candidatus Fermentibacterales bacterium]
MMRACRTPRNVEICITNQCNLRCTYCSHFSSEGSGSDDLPTGEWLAFFEELNRCSVLEVVLGGGEPLLRGDLMELVNGIVTNRMRFRIQTNGLLLTLELAASLRSTGRCHQVQLSIDGSCPEVHDHFRGDGSFEGVITGLRILQKSRLPISVRVTVHKRNVDDLERIATLLLEGFGLPAFSTNSASYMGLCRQNADEVQLGVEEHSRAMEALLRLGDRYPGRILANAGPLSNARHWLDMERARKEGLDPFPDCGYLRSCGGVFSKITVRADGVIVPCVQMTHIELGRINRSDLRVLWQEHPGILSLRRRWDVPLGSFEFCRGCPYIPYCRGNCPALAYTILGVENHPSPDACLRRFLDSGGKLPRVS